MPKTPNLPDPGPDLILLGGGNSHSVDGCDRISLDKATGLVLVQGEERHRYPAGSNFRVPGGEVLGAIAPEVLLEAADALRARLGR